MKALLAKLRDGAVRSDNLQPVSKRDLERLREMLKDVKISLDRR